MESPVNVFEAGDGLDGGEDEELEQEDGVVDVDAQVRVILIFFFTMLILYPAIRV